MFEEDVAARKKLVELLVGEPNIHLATINAVLREVVTKVVLRSSGKSLEARSLNLNSVSID